MRMNYNSLDCLIFMMKTMNIDVSYILIFFLYFYLRFRLKLSKFI